MKKLTVICCFIISNFLVNAQDQKLENSVLWKIEHKDLAKPSYLLGTIHILCEDDFSIPEKVTKAFNETENLVLEVDLSNTEALVEAQQKMISSGKLTEKLSQEQQLFLDSLLQKELKMTLEMVNNYSLMAVYSLLTQQGLNCPTKKMYEFELINLAQAKTKPIAGLETLNDQLDFFAKAYPKDFLWQQIELYSAYKLMFKDMVKHYKNEDISTLFAGMKDERFFNKNAEHWMLTVRNTNWIKLMPDMMKKQSNLFAVGAAHLVGKNGVIELLRKEGYKVTPVL
ncbi:TraB/GumN family protein [uncultured Kordia sp.]|uniref:TraB/GumN family protein n=1 Tax=uncultured Kordia sp. TaxID=507699 RepID=UPI00262FFC48|nr:TraB/GumN family protein [uncultured Kordia sp.]